MNSNKSFAFNVEIEDTAASYEIDLMLRNTDVFPRQNLWLKVEQEHNGYLISVDTLNIFLLDHNGKWIGKGLCSKYDNEFIWKQQVRFPEKGSYIASGRPRSTRRASLTSGRSRPPSPWRARSSA